MQIQSEKIRKFIIGAVDAHPNDIAKLTAEQFSITRQAVNRHLKILIEDGLIEATGKTRERIYRLKVINNTFEFVIAEDHEEDRFG